VAKLNEAQKHLLCLHIAMARDALTILLDEAVGYGFLTVVTPSRTLDGQHVLEVQLLNPVELSFKTPKGTMH
jgi:hypothetical protein